MSELSIGIVWKFAEKSSAQIISFVVSIVLARLLLPEEYGLIAIVNVFIIIADVFLSAGFSNALVQKKNSDEVDFSTVFVLNTAISVVIYILLYFLAPYIAVFYNNDELTAVLRVLGVKLIFASYGGIQQAYISRYMLFKRTAIVTIIATFFSGAVGIIAALIGYGVWALVAQQLSLTLIQIILLQIVIKWKPKFAFSKNRAQGMLSYGLLFLLSNLLDTLSTQIRGLLIGKMYSSSELAYYNRGDSYPQVLLNSINNTLHVVLFATYSQRQENIEEVKSMAKKSVKMSAFLVFPMMTGLAVVARPLVSILLTDKWLACVPFLQVACVTYATWIIQIVNQEAITALGKADNYFTITVLRSVFSLMALIVSAQFGVICIAVSAAISNIFSVVLVMHYSNKIFGYGIFELLCDIFPAVSKCVIMAVIVFMLTLIINNNLVLLIIQVLTGIATYFGLAYYRGDQELITLIAKYRHKRG